MSRSLPTIGASTNLTDQFRSAGPLPLPAGSNIAPSQPVLVPEDYEPWLDPCLQDVEQMQGLLRSYPVGELVAEPGAAGR